MRPRPSGQVSVFKIHLSAGIARISAGPEIEAVRTRLTVAKEGHAAELAAARAQADTMREALTHERTQRAVAPAGGRRARLIPGALSFPSTARTNCLREVP